MNKVILIGHLGANPDVRQTPESVMVAQFNIATTEFWTDRNTNEKKSQTDWHRVVAWRGLATIAKNYMQKGSHVCIEGKIKTRSWDDEKNIKRYVTEIIADNITLLDKKGARNEEAIPHPSTTATNNVQDSKSSQEQHSVAQGSDTKSTNLTNDSGISQDNDKADATDDLPF